MLGLLHFSRTTWEAVGRYRFSLKGFLWFSILDFSWHEGASLPALPNTLELLHNAASPESKRSEEKKATPTSKDRVLKYCPVGLLVSAEGQNAEGL